MALDALRLCPRRPTRPLPPVPRNDPDGTSPAIPRSSRHGAQQYQEPSVQYMLFYTPPQEQHEAPSDIYSMAIGLLESPVVPVLLFARLLQDGRKICTPHSCTLVPLDTQNLPTACHPTSDVFAYQRPRSQHAPASSARTPLCSAPLAGAFMILHCETR